MKLKSKLFKAAIVAAAFSPALQLQADEGMWMLNSISPKNMAVMKQLGLQMSESDLYNPDGTSLKDAVVSFGGFCSGVIVSPDGLVFTNHHCGFGNIQALSTPENDYLKNGFVADTRDKELPAPGLFVNILQKTEEVTDRINQSMETIYATTTRKQRRKLGAEWKTKLLEQKIDSICSVIEEEYTKGDKTLRALVSSYYTRNAWYVSVYKHYEDVRLVFAPPQSLGKFGGETDNWMWPRQTCDFSVFRIYTDQNNQPAEYHADNRPMQAERYAKVSLNGFGLGDYCMTLGFPGSTNRYLSSYGIEERVNSINMARINVRGVKQDVWKKWMESDPAINLMYASKYASSSNYWKNSIGMNKAIDDLDVIEEKQELEEKIKEWINSNPENRKRFGKLFKNLEKAYDKREGDFHALNFMRETFLSGSDIFGIANTLAAKAITTNEQRLTFINDALDKKYKDFSADVDREATAALLKHYAESVDKKYLPAFYKTIQKDFNSDYTAFTNDLFDRSALASPKAMEMDAESLKNDPAIIYFNQFKELYQKLSKNTEEQSLAIRANEKLLCQAILEMEANQPHYSDANSTLRLSYGIVADYTNEGVHQNYFTTSQSLLDKIAQSDKIADYEMEPSITNLLKQGDFGPYIDQRTGEMQLCFLTNNDITGGNSGSPMFNSKGELIGLAFDGNWDAMSSDISFTQDLTRCIGVDIRYVLYVIDRWGKAANLIQEINAGK